MLLIVSTMLEYHYTDCTIKQLPIIFWVFHSTKHPSSRWTLIGTLPRRVPYLVKIIPRKPHHLSGSVYRFRLLRHSWGLPRTWPIRRQVDWSRWSRKYPRFVFVGRCILFLFRQTRPLSISPRRLPCRLDSKELHTRAFYFWATRHHSSCLICSKIFPCRFSCH